MTRGEAEELLALARDLRWTFPSSSGTPVRRSEPLPGALERLVNARERLVDAARTLTASGDGEAAMELAANAWRVWMVGRDIDGGRRFLGAVLDEGEQAPSRSRALALYGDGLFAFWQGDDAASWRRNEEALECAESAGDPEALALANLGLSRVLLNEGRYEASRAAAKRARAHAGELGEAMRQAPLHMHAQAARAAGDYGEAAALFAESLALNRRIEDGGMVVVELHNLGHVEIHLGNVDRAEQLFAELEQLEDGADPYGEAMTGLNRAALAYRRGDLERARELLSGAEATLAGSGIDPSADDRAELDWLEAQLLQAEGAG